MVHFFDIEDNIVRNLRKLKLPYINEEGIQLGFNDNEKYCREISSFDENGDALSYKDKIDNINFDEDKNKTEILNECLDITRLKTKNKIYEGFSVELNAVTINFKYNDEAQANWTALFSARDSMVYPFTMRDVDRAIIELANASEVSTCYVAGLLWVSSNVEIGNLVEDSLYACDTVSQMRLIVDGDER